MRVPDLSRGTSKEAPLSTHPAFDFTQSTLTWEDWLEDLRGLVANSRREFAITHQMLALKANVSPTTLARFADGITKRPHARTILELARVLRATRYVEPAVRDSRPPKQVDQLRHVHRSVRHVRGQERVTNYRKSRRRLCK